jgi:hypothetical protein
MILTGLLGLLIVLPASVRADEKKADEKKADEKEKLPVTAKLVAKKATYTLDLGDKSADEFKKAIEEGKKTGKVPPAPAVELVLEITNTSEKDVEIWFKGDAVTVDLDLKGPGALSAGAAGAFTTDIRLPEAMTLAAGKTHSIPFASLQYGFRGTGMRAYWTEAGDYTLAATFKTGIKPAPKDAKNLENGFAKVTLTSEPVKIKVEAKK